MAGIYCGYRMVVKGLISINLRHLDIEDKKLTFAVTDFNVAQFSCSIRWTLALKIVYFINAFRAKKTRIRHAFIDLRVTDRARITFFTLTHNIKSTVFKAVQSSFIITRITILGAFIAVFPTVSSMTGAHVRTNFIIANTILSAGV